MPYSNAVFLTAYTAGCLSMVIYGAMRDREHNYFGSLMFSLIPLLVAAVACAYIGG